MKTECVENLSELPDFSSIMRHFEGEVAYCERLTKRLEQYKDVQGINVHHWKSLLQLENVTPLQAQRQKRMDRRVRHALGGKASGRFSPPAPEDTEGKDRVTLYHNPQCPGGIKVDLPPVVEREILKRTHEERGHPIFFLLSEGNKERTDSAMSWDSFITINGLFHDPHLKGDILSFSTRTSAFGEGYMNDAKHYKVFTDSLEESQRNLILHSFKQGKNHTCHLKFKFNFNEFPTSGRKPLGLYTYNPDEITFASFHQKEEQTATSQQPPFYYPHHPSLLLNDKEKNNAFTWDVNTKSNELRTHIPPDRVTGKIDAFIIDNGFESPEHLPVENNPSTHRAVFFQLDRRAYGILNPSEETIETIKKAVTNTAEEYEFSMLDPQSCQITNVPPGKIMHYSSIQTKQPTNFTQNISKNLLDYHLGGGKSMCHVTFGNNGKQFIFRPRTDPYHSTGKIQDVYDNEPYNILLICQEVHGQDKWTLFQRDTLKENEREQLIASFSEKHLNPEIDERQSIAIHWQPANKSAKSASLKISRPEVNRESLSMYG